MQKIINKKLKLTKEEREAIYYNAKFHERTWFRLVVENIVGYSIKFFWDLQYDDIFGVVLSSILRLIFVYYFLMGKSRTRIGRIIQLLYGYGMIMIFINFFISYIFIILPYYYQFI